MTTTSRASRRRPRFLRSRAASRRCRRLTRQRVPPQPAGRAPPGATSAGEPDWSRLFEAAGLPFDRFRAGDARVDALGLRRSARGLDRRRRGCGQSADPRRSRGASRPRHVFSDPLSVVRLAAGERDTEDVRGACRRHHRRPRLLRALSDCARDGAAELSFETCRSSGRVLVRGGNVHAVDGAVGARSETGRRHHHLAGSLLHRHRDFVAAERPPVDLLSRARADGASFLARRLDLLDPPRIRRLARSARRLAHSRRRRVRRRRERHAAVCSA